VRLLLLSSLPLSCALEHYFWALEWMRMRASCSLNEQLTASCYILRLGTSIGEDNNGLAMDPLACQARIFNWGVRAVDEVRIYRHSPRATTMCMLVIICSLQESLLSIFISMSTYIYESCQVTFRNNFYGHVKFSRKSPQWATQRLSYSSLQYGTSYFVQVVLLRPYGISLLLLPSSVNAMG
jgi:hypothetical protein